MKEEGEKNKRMVRKYDSKLTNKEREWNGDEDKLNAEEEETTEEERAGEGENGEASAIS